MKNKILVLVRIFLGWTFVWAFIDKLFGLGFSTKSAASWINGGSPTYGFLTHATKGPFAEFYRSLAGNVFADWVFMIGILLIGVSLMTGILVKISGWFAAILLLLMYSAGFIPPENNPIIDEHIIFALLSIYFALSVKKLPIYMAKNKV
jgi:thiosulfate dehydrogenase [quinone] large subunit